MMRENNKNNKNKNIKKNDIDLFQPMLPSPVLQ